MSVDSYLSYDSVGSRSRVDTVDTLQSYTPTTPSAEESSLWETLKCCFPTFAGLIAGVGTGLLLHHFTPLSENAVVGLGCTTFFITTISIVGYHLHRSFSHRREN